MAFHPQAATAGRRPRAENMVPLIDVMLVLLVIFMVAAPLLTHAVKVELPRASSTPREVKAEDIQLALQADGAVSWNGEAVDAQALGRKMKEAAARQPQPELHIHADARTPYEHLAKVMAASARAGLARIGFVSEPEKAH